MKNILVVLTVLTISFTGNTQFIQGSIRKNSTNPAKIDIVFKSNYTSAPGEYSYYLQFAVTIPAAVSSGVSATAIGVNTFSNMGTLAPIEPYTETFGTSSTADDERIFGWIFSVPAASKQSWTKESEFTGVEVTFNTSVAATEVKLASLSNINGGTNLNTYYSIFSTAGDLTNNKSLFYEIPRVNNLGIYPGSNDQFVQTGVLRRKAD